MKLGIFGGGLLYSIAAATPLGAVILVAIARLFSGAAGSESVCMRTLPNHHSTFLSLS